MAKTFDGPPTLERSGSEHRVGRFTSFLLRRKAWLEVELPLERETEGFEKIPSLMWKSDASECNESSLSNCRVQLALSTRKDGMICMQSHFEIMWCNQNEYNEQRETTKDWLFPFVRLESMVSGVSVIITKVATKRKMEKPPRRSISILSKAQK